MVRSWNTITYHLINVALITISLTITKVVLASALSFPSLIGQIVSSSNYKSLAIFKTGERVYTKRIGDLVNGYWITSINYRYVSLQDQYGKHLLLRVGDTKFKPKRKLISGLEISDDHIVMSNELRNYIAEENLLTIMMQAASEPYYNNELDVIGYQLFEIEPESIYDLVGIQNGDVITHIDGINISNPWTAISLLKSVRHQDYFTFTYLRNGSETTVDVNVTY